MATLSVTTGYSWTNGEVVTATKLNSAASPTIAANQTYTFGNGTVGAPSFNFTGSTTTGLYYSAGIQIAIAGVNVGSVTATALTHTAAKGQLVLNGTDAAGNDTGYITFQQSGTGGARIANSGTSKNLSFQTNGTTQALELDIAQNVICGSAAILTTATDGFLYLPSCAGTPTGVPTTVTGRIPCVVDSTNNLLYFYSGGAWRAS